MKIKFVFGCILLIAMLIFNPAFLSAQVPTLPGAEGSAFGTYLNDVPAQITKITQTPEQPSAQEKVKITAEIFNDPEKTDDTTTSALLYYSIDEGKTWSEVAMTQNKDNEKLWTAEIEGQPAGTKVIYYLAAKDTAPGAGNLTTQMPGKNTVWPPKIDPKDAKSSVYPLLAKSNTDPDDAEAQVANDLDVVEVGVGYNDERVFLKIKTQGKISPGTNSPVYVHGYAVGILNPDLGEDILKGKIIFYAPLAKMANWPEVALLDESTIRTQQPMAPAESGVEHFVDNDTLYLTCKREILGKNTCGALKCIFLTAALTSLDLANITSALVPLDASNYVYFYLNTQSYTVK